MPRFVAILVLALAAPLALGCSCQDGNGPAGGDGGPGGDGAPRRDAPVPNDGNGFDAPGFLDTSSSDDAFSAGTGDAWSINCRGAGSAMCGGACVNVQIDPNNCGSCGHMCMAGQVCLSNGCANNCLAGLTACGGTCVDTTSDNANCGGCGQPCAADHGCLGSTCVPSVHVGPAPARCVGGGPPIDFGSMMGSLCSGTLARTTFTHGLCTCQTIGVPELGGDLYVDAFDSTMGPYTPGGVGGHVGADVHLQSSAITDISGNLEMLGNFAVNGDTRVRQDLLVQGSMDLAQTLMVGGNAQVGGNITINGTGSIAGSLRTPSCPGGGNGLTYASCMAGSVRVPEPCRCDATELIPVHALVQHYAMPANNDDMAIMLDPGALMGAGAGRLDLPCGYYYLSGISAGATTIAVHGRTAVFIGSSFTVGSPLTFTLDPGATLDVFVDGNITTDDVLTVGTPAYPARSRFYVSGSVTINNASTLNGLFYCANGPFTAGADIEMYGAIFARTYDCSSATHIHYDRAAVTTPDDCSPPPPPPVDAGPPNDAWSAMPHDAWTAPPTDSGVPPTCTPGAASCGIGMPACPAGWSCLANCCVFLG
jgi:hypothetical protein